MRRLVDSGSFEVGGKLEKDCRIVFDEAENSIAPITDPPAEVAFFVTMIEDNAASLRTCFADMWTFAPGYHLTFFDYSYPMGFVVLFLLMLLLRAPSTKAVLGVQSVAVLCAPSPRVGCLVCFRLCHSLGPFVEDRWLGAVAVSEASPSLRLISWMILP